MEASKRAHFTLARFAAVRFHPPLVPPLPESYEFDDVYVAISANDSEGLPVMLSAGIALFDIPELTADGLLVVPPEPRRRAERVIEIVANLLAVANVSRRRITSPRRTIALRPLTPSAERWLAGVAGIHGQEQLVGSPQTINRIDPSSPVMENLSDRLDGVALLAEAHAQVGSTGEFVDLIRLFERAFKAPIGKVPPLLEAFLPEEFGYSHKELTTWVELRHQAAHADVRHEFIVQADVQPHIPRLQQAAYDVLLNKVHWRSSSLNRRERWRSNAWSSAPGHINVEASTTTIIGTSMLDQFGAYPVSGWKIEVPPEWWSPVPPDAQLSHGIEIV